MHPPRRKYTTEELNAINQKGSDERLAKGQIEDLEDEIEKLTELRNKWKTWLENGCQGSHPLIWDRWPNG